MKRNFSGAQNRPINYALYYLIKVNKRVRDAKLLSQHIGKRHSNH